MPYFKKFQEFKLTCPNCDSDDTIITEFHPELPIEQTVKYTVTFLCREESQQALKEWSRRETEKHVQYMKSLGYRDNSE